MAGRSLITLAITAITWFLTNSFLSSLISSSTIYMLLRYFEEEEQHPHQEFLEDTSRATPKEISCLTYNIFLRPPFIKNNADDFKNERLQEFIKMLKVRHFDIVCLQEIFPLGNTRKSTLIREAKEIGFKWSMASRSPFPRLQKNYLDGGLLILSRYPLTEQDHFVFTKAHQVDSWVAKQVIYAKVHVSKQIKFHLFTTHMQASYLDCAPEVNMENDKARLVQVDEMAQFLHSKVTGTPHPALITGDFNVNARGSGKKLESEEYEYLMNKINNEEKSCSPDHFPVVDLLKAHTGVHPPTYADIHPLEHEGAKPRPRETILTDLHDHCTQLSIDYIMYLDCKQNQENQEFGVAVKPDSTKVEEFFLDHPKITQISDHYGVSTVLLVNSK